MKEEIKYVVDSLGVEHMETYDAPSFSIPDYFVMGGLGGMIVITVLLICLLLAAWKAPRWVKEIGIAALVVSVFWSLMGLTNMCDAVQMTGDAAPVILFGGLKVCLISVLYGLIVYFISLILRIIQKPRI